LSFSRTMHQRMGRTRRSNFFVKTTLKWFLMLPTHLTWHIHQSCRYCISDFPVVKTDSYRSVRSGHGLMASTLWKMCTAAGRLRWKVTEVSNFLYDYCARKKIGDFRTWTHYV
jgi:membrane-associated phospholipid phosphatase